MKVSFTVTHFQNRSLVIVRRRSQLFVKIISLRSLLHSTRSQVQTSSPINQLITSMNHQWSSTTLDVGAVQELFSSATQLFSNIFLNPRYNAFIQKSTLCRM